MPVKEEKSMLKVINKGISLFRIDDAGNVYGKNDRLIGNLNAEEKTAMLNIFAVKGKKRYKIIQE